MEWGFEYPRQQAAVFQQQHRHRLRVVSLEGGQVVFQQQHRHRLRVVSLEVVQVVWLEVGDEALVGSF